VSGSSIRSGNNSRGSKNNPDSKSIATKEVLLKINVIQSKKKKIQRSDVGF
jgi:hypothetical protein